MQEIVKDFTSALAELTKQAERVEEEMEAYRPKGLRIRINEAFKRYMDSKEDKLTAGKELLAEFGCKSTVDLKPEQFEKFVTAVGGI